MQNHSAGCRKQRNKCNSRRQCGHCDQSRFGESVSPQSRYRYQSGSPGDRPGKPEKSIGPLSLLVVETHCGCNRGCRQRCNSTGSDITFVKSLQIPLPPTADQQRIVGILDEAFEGIAIAKTNAENNLQNARAIFESHLQSVFTRRGKEWVVRKISELAKHSLGKMLDKAKNKGEPKTYLRNLNVRWFTFDLSDLLQMPFLPEEAGKYTALKGDVLVCEGGYPGRAAIWDGDCPIHFQKALHRVRFHEPGHNKWFVYYLFAQDKSGELKRHFSGTGIQHFTGEVLARFEIPLPPPTELRRVLAKFDELWKLTLCLAGIYERKLATLEALKKSLLHQAFTGKL
jgi:type I restriction enzyme, S subunit